MERKEKQERLQDLRRQTGMNRRQFSDLYGIPYPTLTDWELGKRRVPDYLLRLLEYRIGTEKKESKDLAESKDLLYRQLSLDYCCSIDQVKNSENQYHEYVPLEGRRRFEEREYCFLKVLTFRNKLFFTGEAHMVGWCRDRYRDTEAAWFMEAGMMKELNRRLAEEGYEIHKIHPFFISWTESQPESTDWTARYFRGPEIEDFREDERFRKAFSFCPTAPDEIGVAAMDGESILGMAGVSADSDLLWQIGIDVTKEARGRKIGVGLVKLLKNEVLRLGKLPYYGTAVSHNISQNIAFQAGFRPAWTELTTRRIGDE